VPGTALLGRLRVVAVCLIKVELPAFWLIELLLHSAIGADDQNPCVLVLCNSDECLAVVLENDDSVAIGLQPLVRTNFGPSLEVRTDGTQTIAWDAGVNDASVSILVET
jgi:hypothetical protein